MRQLERLLLNAAEGPMTNPELVKARIAAETRQASILNSFEFKLAGQPITVNEIDNLLQESRDLARRRAVWEASKLSGPALKPGLIELQRLRNGVARELGYADYFALQAAAHGMTTADVLRLQSEFMRDLRPLYLQLHTWVKHELARRYQQPVPERIPAHWIDNRWAQEWVGLVDAVDFDPHLKDRSAEWIVQTAEAFWTGLGFPAVARHVLGEVGSLPGQTGRSAEEEHARLVLAHRSRNRYPLVDECRAELAMVRDGPSRARARLLRHQLHPAGGATAAANRGEPGLSRGHGGSGEHGVRHGARI